MLGILFDFFVLMLLLKTIDDEDISFLVFIVAAVASLGTSALTLGLASQLGFAGIVLAAVIAAPLLGFLICILFGTEIRRAIGISALFIVIHVAFRVAMYFMFSA